MALPALHEPVAMAAQANQSAGLQPAGSLQLAAALAVLTYKRHLIQMPFVFML